MVTGLAGIMKLGVDPAATGKTRFSLQDIDTCDHSLEVWKGKLKGMFFDLFPVSVAGVTSNLISFI